MTISYVKISFFLFWKYCFYKVTVSSLADLHYKQTVTGTDLLNTKPQKVASKDGEKKTHRELYNINIDEELSITLKKSIQRKEIIIKEERVTFVLYTDIYLKLEIFLTKTTNKWL